MHPSRTRHQFFSFLKLFLDSYVFLTRDRVYSLQLLLGLTSLSLGFMTIFYCLNFWDANNLEGQVPIFISPRNKVAQLYPQALGWSITICASPFLYIKFFRLWLCAICDLCWSWEPFRSQSCAVAVIGKWCERTVNMVFCSSVLTNGSCYIHTLS
jgi:hypothetical protein